MQKLNSSQKAYHLRRLRQMMVDAFSEGDLRTICIDLSVDYEDLAGNRRSGKIRELILHLMRTNRLPELLSLLQEERPNNSWPTIDELPDSLIAASIVFRLPQIGQAFLGVILLMLLIFLIVDSQAATNGSTGTADQFANVTPAVSVNAMAEVVTQSVAPASATPTVPPTATIQPPDTPVPEPTATPVPIPYYLFIVDLSDRMADGFGENNKFNAAINSLKSWLVPFPNYAKYGLTVLGGQRPTMQGTELINDAKLVPLGANKRDVDVSIRFLEPAGKACLAGAMLDALKQLTDPTIVPQTAERKLIIIVGGGDECFGEDQWETLIQFIEEDAPELKIQLSTELIVLRGVDETNPEIDSLVDRVTALDIPPPVINQPQNEVALQMAVQEVTVRQAPPPQTVAEAPTTSVTVTSRSFINTPQPTSPINQSPVAPTAVATQPILSTATSVPTFVASSTAVSATTPPTPSKTWTPIATSTPLPPTATSLPPTATRTPTTAPTQTTSPTMQPCPTNRPALTNTGGFSGTAAFATPSDCMTGYTAESAILTSGTYTGLAANLDLWVLVYPPNGLYYPQSPDACNGTLAEQSNGNWNVNVFLGNASDASGPEWHYVVLVYVDQATSQYLSNWVITGCQTGSFTGIPSAELEMRAVTEKAFIRLYTNN